VTSISGSDKTIQVQQENVKAFVVHEPRVRAREDHAIGFEKKTKRR
jgi:hypothetical protein